jgi:glycerophosphoryl diester phosphodiesterase
VYGNIGGRFAQDGRNVTEVLPCSPARPALHAALCRARPLVFAHRGGARLGPENTLVAFDRGLAAGVDGFELDVRLSRDGVAVVHHDDTLDRTTGTCGPIGRFTADELGRVDAAFRFRPAEGYPLRGKGIGIPRLADVLARYPDVPMIVEVKGASAPLARAAIDAIRAAGAVDRVCLGSFSLVSLRAARAYEPRLPTGAGRAEIRWALYRSWLRWPYRRTRWRAYQVPERSGRTTIVTPRFVRDAHRAGVAVQVWVVDEPGDLRRLLAWGADAVISDRPDVAVRTVKAWLHATRAE